MRVELTETGIITIPETDFEEQWLTKLCPHGKGVEGFLKCGVTPREVIGVKLYPREEE